MKKLMLVSLILFSFFQKINGQFESHLIKKIGQIYSDSLNTYVDYLEEIYEYDERGNKTSFETINYDIDGNVTSWTGIKYDYDSQNRLIKEINRRYNWDVGIWITIYWIEITYDENGCVKERYTKVNSANTAGQIEKIISTDAQCRETEIHSFWENASSIPSVIKIEYDEEEDSKLESYYGSNTNLINPLYEIFIDHNEHGDEVERTLSVYWSAIANGLQVQTSKYSIIEYINDWKNEKKLKKRIQTTETGYDLSTSGNSPFIRNTENVYQYSCDELITEEVNIVTIFQNENMRFEYIYAGEDACFDFENKSTALIYPNPTSGHVEIESPLLASGNTQVRVLDIGGRVLLEKIVFSREEKISLNVSDLVNGTYMLQLMSGEHFITKKIVLIK